jgi:hypothetical protein
MKRKYLNLLKVVKPCECFELDNEYFQIAKDRIEQAQKFPGTEYKKPTASTNKKLF